MKLSIGKKAERHLKLLMGLNDPKVVRALRKHGFGEGELEVGWQRLRQLSKFRLRYRRKRGRNKAAIEILDQFENRWFPITKAALMARFPEIAELLFENLPQGSGPEVVVTVVAFLGRVQALARGEEPYGEQGPEARAVLDARGLTDTVIAEAFEAATIIETVSEEDESTITREDRDAAEKAMWDWYLEWSAIARTVITDRQLLKGMGFRPRKPGSSDEDKEQDAEEDDDPVENENAEAASNSEADDNVADDDHVAADHLAAE